MRYFYAIKNPLVEGEWQVFMNNEIFCHLSESDFRIFVDNFKFNVEVLED